MGGFAGGDEAGYWDEDTPILSPSASSKPTDRIKPSILHTSNGYTIQAHAKIDLSNPERWIRSDELFDTIEFTPSACHCLTIEGCEDAPLIRDAIEQAYHALLHATNDPEIEEFFAAHKVTLTRRIPSETSYGASSSNAAAFLHLTKEVCNLILTTDELAKIGNAIASDIPFFIYNYPQATVSASGTIVELLDD